MVKGFLNSVLCFKLFDNNVKKKKEYYLVLKTETKIQNHYIIRPNFSVQLLLLLLLLLLLCFSLRSKYRQNLDKMNNLSLYGQKFKMVSIRLRLVQIHYKIYLPKFSLVSQVTHCRFWVIITISKTLERSEGKTKQVNVVSNDTTTDAYSLTEKYTPKKIPLLGPPPPQPKKKKKKKKKKLILVRAYSLLNSSTCKIFSVKCKQSTHRKFLPKTKYNDAFRRVKNKKWYLHILKQRNFV
jgi:hypothetical protein